MALANPVELLESLRSHPAETEWFEFKKGHFKPDDFGEYVSALANSAMLHDKRHAFLVYGVQDATHEIVGTELRLKTEKVNGGELLESWLTRFLSPKINVTFEACDIAGKHVEIVCIEPAYDRPVKFINVAYVRINSVKRRLDEFPEKERTLWQLTSRFAFEEGIAATHLSKADIFGQFACTELAELLYEGKPLSQDRMINQFIAEGLIIDDMQGGYDITNLFALCAANDVHQFKTISHKALRVITYKTNTTLTAEADTTGVLGYAVAFQKILAYVMKAGGVKEVMLHGIRRRESAYPEKAIREFLANALIHQDLVAQGRPVVEVFQEKLQFTNPGAPLVDINRLIDAPARSRNEKLAGLMRKAKLCEERGSGVDRAIWAIEEMKLAPPTFKIVEGSTVVTMFKGTTFSAMSKDDRMRACYQHASLKFLQNDPMSNASLRARLGLNKNQYPQVSNVIGDALEVGLIRPLVQDQGNRLARYVPFWA